jgi:hypothetical protein
MGLQDGDQHIVGEFATTKVSPKIFLALLMSHRPSGIDFNYFLIKKYGASTTPVLVELLNFFGEKGGFTKILERLENTQHKIPVNCSLYYLKALDNVRIVSLHTISL